MTVNDFNNRINLPAYCDKNGIKGLQFVRIPRYGWFAADPTTGVVGNIFDFFKANEMTKAVEDIILNKPELHNFHIRYNQLSITHLLNDLRIHRLVESFHKDSIIRLNESPAEVKGRLILLGQWFKEEGYTGFSSTKVGLITPNLLEEKMYQPLNLDPKLVNKLLIPSFATPCHVCSLETAPIVEPNNKITLWKNEEYGWYGGVVNGPITGTLTKLFTVEGTSWDKKLNFWITKPVELDNSLSVSQCLDIWTNGKKFETTNSPLDIIAQNNEAEKLKFYVRDLTLSQIEKLEKRFQISLKEAWQTQRQDFVKISKLLFIAKDNRYYVQRKNGDIDEFTNFDMRITSIAKKGARFVRTGVVHYEDSEIPFEIDNQAFLSCKAFLPAINKFFFENRLGVPMVLTPYQTYLIDVINRFNARNLVFED